MAKSAVLLPALLGYLHELDPGVLARVASLRTVTLDADQPLLTTCHTLCSEAAVERHLRVLSREDLEALGRLADEGTAQNSRDTLAPLVDSLLVEATTSGFTLADGVVEALSRIDLPGALNRPAPKKPATVSKESLRTHSLRAMPVALDTLVRLESLLRALSTEPVVARSAWQRGLERLAGADRGDFDTVAPLALLTGLAVRHGSLIGLTDTADSWLELSREHQWAESVRRWFNAGPPATATVLSHSPHAPADPEWWSTAVLAEFPLASVDAVVPWLDAGRSLGVFDTSHPTLWGDALASGNQDALVTPARELLPSPVATVYPEGVSSFLAPGFPAQELDQSLRRFASAHPRGLTTAYTVTPTSIVGGLESGLTAEDIVGILEKYVVGGVPEGIRDLVERVCHGATALSLSLDPRGGTLLTVSDPELHALLLVDRSLQSLQLVEQDSVTLSTRAPLEEVRSTLAESGYPSLNGSSLGGSLAGFPPGASAPGRWHTQDDEAAQIEAAREIVRAAQAAQASGSRPWLADVLLAAVSSREAVELGVLLDGVERWFTVEPTSMHQGRLRARDVRSDVERTFPLHSVIDVLPVGHRVDRPA